MLWSGNLKGEGTNHFPLFQLRDMLLEYQPPFRLDLGLLPDRMLGKDLVGRGKCRVMVNIWIPFE